MIGVPLATWMTAPAASRSGSSTCSPVIATVYRIRRLASGSRKYVSQPLRTDFSVPIWAVCPARKICSLSVRVRVLARLARPSLPTTLPCPSPPTHTAINPKPQGNPRQSTSPPRRRRSPRRARRWSPKKVREMIHDAPRVFVYGVVC